MLTCQIISCERGSEICKCLATTLIIVACLHEKKFFFFFLCPTYLCMFFSISYFHCIQVVSLVFVLIDAQEPCQFNMSSAECSDFKALG